MLYYNHMNTLVYQEKDPQAIPLTESVSFLRNSLTVTGNWGVGCNAGAEFDELLS